MKKGKLVLAIISIALIVAIVSFCVFLLKQDWTSNELTFPDFVINDTLESVTNKKAHVILLNGQSNASGVAYDVYLQQKTHPDKYQEYSNGYENVYINYFNDGGTNKSDGFVKAKTNQGCIVDCFGPEIGLAEKLHELYPNETFFIIKYTWSGTTLCNQWLSPTSRGATGPLYTQFKKFTAESINYLLSKGYDVSVDAMCWMQGESDGADIEASNKYQTHLKNLIADVRAEFKKYTTSQIVFVDAYISQCVFWQHFNTINNAKYKVSQLSQYNVCIDTISQGLTQTQEPENNPDILHYDSLSQIKLGHLFAEAIVSKIFN